MKSTKSISLHKNVRHIQHSLNLSKTKTTFSFEKSKRFPDPTSYSPNKFYNPTSDTHRISFSMGKSNRFSEEKSNALSPNKYKISSEFEKKHHRNGSDTFGISR